MAADMLEGLVRLLDLLGSPDQGVRQQAEAHYTHLRETSAPHVSSKEREIGETEGMQSNPSAWV